MFFIDILLYQLFNILFPEKPATSQGAAPNRDPEDSANWIILEDLHNNGKLVNRQEGKDFDGNCCEQYHEYDGNIDVW